MQLYLNKKEVELIYSALRLRFVVDPHGDNFELTRKIYYRMKKCEQLQNQTEKGKIKK